MKTSASESFDIITKQFARRRIPAIRMSMVLTLLLSQLLAQQVAAQNARTFYGQLYKSGALDRFADSYVCFDDDVSSPNFFIFAKSDAVKQLLEEAGKLSSMPRQERQKLANGFLIVRGYARGVPFSDQDFYDRDGGSWVTEAGKSGGRAMRVRLTVVWGTLRYKRSVEILLPNATFDHEIARFGSCERIPLDVRQTGE